LEVSMKSVPRSSQHTVEFTASLPFSQHSLLESRTHLMLINSSLSLQHARGISHDAVSASSLLVSSRALPYSGPLPGSCQLTDTLPDEHEVSMKCQVARRLNGGGVISTSSERGRVRRKNSPDPWGGFSEENKKASQWSDAFVSRGRSS